MSVDTRIILNSHASAEHVFDVIQKIIGHEFNYKTLPRKENIKYDFNAPSSKENPWYYKPKESKDNRISLDSVNYFVFYFKDCSNNKFHTLFHLQTEDDDFDNGKLLSPRSSAIWCAIGKRLVDFFGGKMLYSDTNDFDNPNNWHVCHHPKYPPRLKGQDSDERWYQYYTALAKEPILTAKEIQDMKIHTAYWAEREDNLLYYLKNCLPKIKLANELSNNLKEKPLNENKTKKMKL